MHCGLDFGTSNTAIGIARGNGVDLVPVEGQSRTLPSAIFFDEETRAISIGRAAIGEYLADQPGRLMRGLKSVLGTGLMADATLVAGQRLGFADIIATFLARAKARVEAAVGHEITHVVHGRPVHFTHDESADARAEAELAAIAARVGFREVSFQLEPIAAALAFEMTLEREALVMIADIGGGTSDFSLVRLDPRRAARAERSEDVLASAGLRLGGTDIDSWFSLARVMPGLGHGDTLQNGRLRTPNHVYVNLSTWSRINEAYAPEVAREIRRILPSADAPDRLLRLMNVIEHRHGHRIAGAVEAAKIALSDSPNAAIDLGFLDPPHAIPVGRPDLEAAVAEGMGRLSAVLRHCLIAARVPKDRVQAVVMTGGSTLLPAVRRAIIRELPHAALHDIDQFGAVATGLALEATRRYR